MAKLLPTFQKKDIYPSEKIVSHVIQCWVGPPLVQIGKFCKTKRSALAEHPSEYRHPKFSSKLPTLATTFVVAGWFRWTRLHPQSEHEIVSTLNMTFLLFRIVQACIVYRGKNKYKAYTVYIAGLFYNINQSGLICYPTTSKDKNGTKIFRTDRFRFLYYDTIFYIMIPFSNFTKHENLSFSISFTTIFNLFFCIP
jgi:hypothetical protein